MTHRLRSPYVPVDGVPGNDKLTSESTIRELLHRAAFAIKETTGSKKPRSKNQHLEVSAATCVKDCLL
jgi:hypothetical protein